ncbi:hypothetical protein [Portibacter marinus]|uniref:hypothetical protein n=1 Tax=Portibacter marinus TaxID=2898660 RepID=UPI0038733A07
MAYPNSGESYHSSGKNWSNDTPPSDLVTMAKGWLQQGVAMIRGYCKIGPEEYEKMSKNLSHKKLGYFGWIESTLHQLLIF